MLNRDANLHAKISPSFPAGLYCLHGNLSLPSSQTHLTSKPSLVVVWLRFLRDTWEGRELGTQPCPRRRYTWLPRMRLRPVSPPVPPLRLMEVTLPPRRLLKKDGVCVDCAVHHQPLREAHLQIILQILFRRVGGGGRNSHGSLYSDSLLFRTLQG